MSFVDEMKSVAHQVMSGGLVFRVPNGIDGSGFRCPACGGVPATYYCEDGIYLVKCIDCGVMQFVESGSPKCAVCLFSENGTR